MSEKRTGYTVLSYGHMVNCEPRMSAYAEALRQAVTPGCTVIDIGAGPGIFSILACKYGAGSVVAIDPSETIELIPALAAANGCADKITVVRGLSTDYEPARKADVIVSDIRGILPLFEMHIPAIADARRRLLAPGGKLIPARDILNVALVSHAPTYRPYAEPWLRNKFDVDFAGGHRFAANTSSKVNLQPDALLSPPQQLATLDYGEIESPDVAGAFNLMAERDGTAHGLLVWFDAELAPGIGFSNAPSEPSLIYGQTFFPFTAPIDLAEGEEVSGEIRARWFEGEYVWTWWTTAAPRQMPEPVEFKQSTFLSKVISPSDLEQRTAEHAPRPRPAHAIDSYCLTLFDGHASLEDVAVKIRERFPAEFQSLPAAIDHATRLAARYEQ